MSLRLVCAVAALAALSCGPQAPSQDAAFVALAERYVEELLETHPEFATALGDHPFDGRLTVYSLDAETPMADNANDELIDSDSIWRTHSRRPDSSGRSLHQVAEPQSDTDAASLQLGETLEVGNQAPHGEHIAPQADGPRNRSPLK